MIRKNGFKCRSESGKLGGSLKAFRIQLRNPRSRSFLKPAREANVYPLETVNIENSMSREINVVVD